MYAPLSRANRLFPVTERVAEVSAVDETAVAFRDDSDAVFADTLPNVTLPATLSPLNDAAVPEIPFADTLPMLAFPTTLSEVTDAAPQEIAFVVTFPHVAFPTTLSELKDAAVADMVFVATLPATRLPATLTSSKDALPVYTEVPSTCRFPHTRTRLKLSAEIPMRCVVPS
jgi:hypothetical protein